MSSGCGCKEVYRFPHITYYLSLLLLYLLFFAAASLLLFIFTFLFQYICVIYLIIFSRSVNTTTGVPRQPYEGLHIMFYTRRNTHKRTLHILRWTSAVQYAEAPR